MALFFFLVGFGMYSMALGGLILVKYVEGMNIYICSSVHGANVALILQTLKI